MQSKGITGCRPDVLAAPAGFSEFQSESYEKEQGRTGKSRSILLLRNFLITPGCLKKQREKKQQMSLRPSRSI